MKGRKLLVSLLVTVALVLGLTLPAAAQVEPSAVTADLAPGESMVVEKEVTTPEIPPKPDIYFLCDTTGSMIPVINAMSDNAGAILAAIAAVQPDAQFGVGSYKDYPHDPLPPFYHQQGITADTTAVSDAIDDWVAGGGVDGPEGQFYALTKIADPGVGWRDGSTKIVVWFGDAPAHDPVPDPPTGLGYDITEATVTTALQGAGIRVVAMSTVTGAGVYYPDALDDDPNKHGGDYAAAYGITENGTPGQASRIATATSGVHMTDVEPEDIVDAILEGLEAIKTDVWGVVEADPGLTVTLDPLVRKDVLSGTSVTFTETIAVDEDATECKTLTATVTFYANSYPAEGAAIGTQQISVHVKDVTPPTVTCIETVNPHGNNVPGKNRGKNSKPKNNQNPDGFYLLEATDNVDDPEDIEIYVSGFGPFQSGDVVKITEDADAVPEMKKMGSTKGQAGEIAAHIILPSDPVVTAVDTAGNTSQCTDCLVPPPPM